MSSHAAAVFDHCILAVRDLDTARARFAAGGFTVTPKGFHPTRGTYNACIMMPGGYIELLGPGPDCVDPVLRAHLARGDGVTALAFDPSDPQAAYEALRRADLDAGPPVDSQRDLDGPEGAETVRFRIVRAQAGALVPGSAFLCRHLDRARVYHPAWLQHPNGVRDIAGFTMTIDPASRWEPVMAKAFGWTCERVAAGGWRIGIGDLAIDMVPEHATAGEPPPSPHPLPRVSMIDLLADDIDLCAAMLNEGGFAPQRQDAAILVPPESACGITLRILSIDAAARLP